MKLKVTKDKEGREVFTPSGVNGNIYLIKDYNFRSLIAKYIKVEFYFRVLSIVCLVLLLVLREDLRIGSGSSFFAVMLGLGLLTGFVQYGIYRYFFKGIVPDSERKFFDHMGDRVRALSRLQVALSLLFCLGLGSRLVYLYGELLFSQSSFYDGILSVIIAFLLYALAAVIVFSRLKKS